MSVKGRLLPGGWQRIIFAGRDGGVEGLVTVAGGSVTVDDLTERLCESQFLGSRRVLGWWWQRGGLVDGGGGGINGNRSLDSFSLHSFKHSFVCCSKVSSGGVSEATIYSEVKVSLKTWLNV